MKTCGTAATIRTADGKAIHSEKGAKNKRTTSLRKRKRFGLAEERTITMENTGNTKADRNAILAKVLLDKDFQHNRDMREQPTRLFESVERRLANKRPLADLLGRPHQSNLSQCCEETLKRRQLIGTVEPVNPFARCRLKTMSDHDLALWQALESRSHEQLVIPFDQDRFLRPSA